MKKSTVLAPLIIFCESYYIGLFYLWYHLGGVFSSVDSGRFNICNKGYRLFDGVVSHLSSKACSKVWEEASLLPELLCVEMLPKNAVWPKSFQISEPSDENIALYFFPVNGR